MGKDHVVRRDSASTTEEVEASGSGAKQVVAVLFAASEGDVDELVKLYASGADLFAADYDLRTALHLAASEGHAEAVRYLLLNAPVAAIDAKDRWGATPRDDAVREKHDACLKYIDEYCAGLAKTESGP